MALSAGGDNELDAIASEAEALARNGLPAGEEGGLRVQAVAERARRGAVDFCSLLESLFDGRASSLGNALGIDHGSISVFTEGQIRASVVFQSAKIASLLLRVSRQITGAAGWDCVVQGEAIGSLKCVERLTPEECAQFTEPVIVLVASADGDEEVSTCGPNVRGVVLCHALPHLSHLALRARQAKVPLIAVEDDKLVEYARSLANEPVVKLSAESTGIKLEPTTAPASAAAASSEAGPQATKPVIRLDADLSRAGTVFDLVALDKRGLEKSIRIAGTKSAMCARLSAIAENSSGSAAFAAPAGVVIPFGAMEFACASISKLEHLDSLLLDLNQHADDPVKMRDTCEAIQNLVRSLKPSASALQSVAKKFGPNARVMVRSSANVEDLEGMSAAGLYDSIPNVDPNSEDAFSRAVGEVWASLYTTRAVASRAAAGVDQLEAHMCVLVQEMLSPEVSFVLHTKHPLTNDNNEAYVEFALGLGETLASGAVRGSPCRVSVDKRSGKATVNAFASFGTALVRDDDSATGMKSVAADYASHWLHNDVAKRDEIATKLLAIGSELERELSPRGETLPQDVEGCILPSGEICIVQARPQP
jgi:phosphoglucan,water dikinase